MGELSIRPEVLAEMMKLIDEGACTLLGGQ